MDERTRSRERRTKLLSLFYQVHHFALQHFFSFLNINNFINSILRSLRPQRFKQTKMSSPFKGAPSLNSLAELLTSSDSSKKPKKIIIAAGAGISTSAGIPDFRSPKTGLYSNLQKYQLPFPEAVFEIGYFLKKPEAFFSLSKELAPGKYKPTPTHVFFRLLHEKKVLSKVFTQNSELRPRSSKLWKLSNSHDIHSVFTLGTKSILSKGFQACHRLALSRLMV